MAAAQMNIENLSRYGGMVLRNQRGEDGQAVTVESLYDVRSVCMLSFGMYNCNVASTHR